MQPLRMERTEMTKPTTAATAPPQTESLDDRLAFIGMDDRAKRRLRGLRSAINAAMGPALTRFYGVLKQHPKMAAFFSDPAMLDSAKKRQGDHWARLAKADFDAEYMAAVRKVGAVHARIGLEPRWYIAGYSIILEELIHRILRRSTWSVRSYLPGGRKALSADLSIIVKAAMLDMDLSISVYLELVEAERARLEAEQRTAFSQLADALQQIAVGNLDVAVDATVSGQTSFNPAVSKLAELIDGVRGSVFQISGAATEISGASSDLATRTEQQAAALEQTAAALEQMTTTVREAADRAKQVDATVAQTGLDAENGNKVAARTRGAMEQIAESSQEVGQIIAIIEEISFQTNLLALNAAVEAARAGDAGRGFAVVAAEVRELAQRSSTAAKSIKTLIDRSSGHVAEGVHLVATTEASLTRIVSAVLEVKGVVGEMARAAQTQASGIVELSSAVNHLDLMTQQNAAMAEQATAASVSLAGNAKEMLALVKQFRTASDRAPASAFDVRGKRVAGQQR